MTGEGNVMRNSLHTTMMVCVVVAMYVAESACSFETQLQAEVKWDHPTAPNSYGVGEDKEEAFRNAKWSCRPLLNKQGQRISNHCDRRPQVVNFTNIPRGAYTEFCKNCSTYRDARGHEVLTCARCELGGYVENPSRQVRRPITACLECGPEWSGPLNLDLNQCSIRKGEYPEFCRDHLNCGACPPDPKPWEPLTR